MKIKSYYAASVESAMNLASQELGPEAMLPLTRKAMPDSSDRLSGEMADLRRQMEQMATRSQRANSVSISNLVSNPELAAIFSSLSGAGVNPAIAQQLVSALRSRPEAASRESLANALREEIAALLTVEATIGRPGAPRKVVAAA